jgi:CrcB protein
MNSPGRRAEALRDLRLVAQGAIPGALLRWGLGHTLAANLLGCLVMGLVLAVAARRPGVMLGLGVGFCGSLTTFSTWMLELARSLLAGRPGEAITVLAVPMAAGLALLSLGLTIGKALMGTTNQPWRER